jgi:dolichyl-diphosphooligosaccharide--protein glycosyltransferase
VGANKPVDMKTNIGKKARDKARQKSIFSFDNRQVGIIVGLIIIFFLSFFPNIAPAGATANDARYAPEDGWFESLLWLKENSPEPFGESDFYHSLYTTPFHYPETAYGVVAWWDYGYWITRIGHRIPNCDPGGGNREGVALFFTAQNEAQGNENIDKLGSEYVIIDYETAIQKFHGVATYAGEITEKYYDDYYGRVENKLVPVRLYHPEYYRSLVIRLYNFNGGAVTPQRSDVISFIERVTPDGTNIKEVISVESFPNYQEAEAHISRQKSSDNYRIVSHDPFLSPVTLEAVKNYELVYKSYSLATQTNVGSIPEVKIFKYIGD